ncbi:hypothetical protein MU582_01355 [Nocardioidaceae bacterium SCSIO 66511]|nr:hypothetical protein MU582_01355 [Nocardioidaceae bacterium SCSIO 66511]
MTWLNHEYTWDAADTIPTCWPKHPHIINEIAVVADQRRRAHLDPASNTLEEWHRYCLPAFIDRMRGRLKAHCDHDHTRWPGRGRHSEYTSDNEAERRQVMFAADAAALNQGPTPQSSRPGPRLSGDCQENGGSGLGLTERNDHDDDRSERS